MNKNKKYRRGALITVVIITVVAVFANLLVQKLFEQYPLKLDVSSNKLFSLSQSTLDLLDRLDTGITVLYLEGTGSEGQMYVPDQVKRVVDVYRSHSGGKIKVESVDPARNPDLAQKYPDLMMEYSSIIFAAGDRAKEVKSSEWISYSSSEVNYQFESLFTNAIAYVTNDEFPKIYFSVGHGEQGGDSQAAYYIQNENYQTGEVALLNEDIPADCKALFIIAPSKDFTDTEIDRLDRYLTNNGKVQIYFDATKSGLPKLYDYLKEWGLQVNDDVVLENAADKVVTNALGILPELESTKFTDTLIENKMTVVAPVSKSIDILPSNIKGATVEPVMQSSDDSFSKVNMDSSSMEMQDGDIKGPRTLGASSRTGTDLENKLLVYGSVQMISETTLNAQYGFANKDLLLNSVAWMEGNDNKIAIRPKPEVSSRLIMTKLQGLVMTWVIVAIFVLFLAYSVFVWYRRRRR